MFDKILIANRGEIAIRVIRTAQSLGIKTVAVYSTADAGAAHVAAADEAYEIGGAAPVDSYLRGDKIIKVALASGAQAVHPGYGFLSENPDFVTQLTAAGLVFIGPSADAIRAMGLKDAAKALMETSGVPVVPGYHGANQNAAFLATEAAKIGYPVLIKAVAGGGGKGMRLVENAADFANALASAQREAQTAFGNPAVLIEKYITAPRHIEVQVFGDGTDAVYLHERDCSLQRRHQKVIEEAPAPGMTADVRAAMGLAAVRAAKSVGYSGAGTVEFIVDGSNGLRADGFWFMEMNTRLQVEHPVTEAITGIDLVEWQLRVAAGEGLPLAQADIALTGHAFEARLYAEDVAAGFLPATGRLDRLDFPPASAFCAPNADGLRVDTGVRTGDVISPHYDPMIAKLIAHGPTRAIALARLRKVLSQTQIAGLTTNLAFLHALAAHDGFGRGAVDTGLIARDLDALVAAPIMDSRLPALALVNAIDIETGPLAGFSLWGGHGVTCAVQLGDEVISGRVEVLSEDHVTVKIGAQKVDFARRNGAWGQGDFCPLVTRAKDKVIFHLMPAVVFERIDPLDRASVGAAGFDGILRAPMPGLVRGVFAVAGDRVAVGARLAILEAMKMEHTIAAPKSDSDFVIAEVLVAEGDQIEAGAPMIRFDMAGEVNA